MFNAMIKKAILSSQRCQRNWDLTKTIPEEDLAVLEAAVSECPSKQNYIFYKPYLITNRDHIEAIYHLSEDVDGLRNPQLLANALVVFTESSEFIDQINDGNIRNHEARDITNKEDLAHSLDFQKNVALGIASGYLNLTASLLGYKTGCCTCVNKPLVQQIINSDRVVTLVMGIGIGDDTRPRRQHHLDKEVTFSTFSKKITVDRIT